MRLKKEDADKIAQANVGNIIRKVKAGRTLTADERKVLAESTGPARKQSYFDSLAAAAAHLAPQLELSIAACERLLKRAKKSGAPGFQHSRVYVEELFPWLKLHFQSEELKLASAGDKESALKCRRLRNQCERGEFAFSVDRGEYVKRAEVEAWLIGAAQKIKAALAQKLRNELPPKLEGLRAAEIADKMDVEIEQIVDFLRGQFQ